MSSLAPGYALWLELAVVLALGTAAIVLLAAIASRFVGSAVWQRTIWQVAALGIAGILAVEFFGAGSALVALFGLHRASAVAEDSPMAAANEPNQSRPRETLADPAAELEMLVGMEAPEALALADSTDAAPSPDFWIAETPDYGETEAPWFFTPGIEDKGGQAVQGTQANGLHKALAGSRRHIPVIAQAWWPGLVWALVAGAIAVRIVWARLLLARFRRRQAMAGPAVSPPWVGALAGRMGIGRRVFLLESPRLKVPVAFGLLRPTLALPASFTEDFSRQEQETILAHELAHLAARDPWWHLLMDLLCAALWWHPLAWWARTKLRAASEAAADEACLLVPGGPDALAACLVALGRKLVNSRRLGWLSIEGPGFRSGLGRRVARLLSLQTQTCRAPAPLRLAIARIVLPLALVVVSILCTAWARPQAPLSDEKGEPTMSVVRSSWQRSLAAMAVAAWLGSANASPAADDQPKEPPHATVTHAEAHTVTHAETAQGEAPKHEVQGFSAGASGAVPHVTVQRGGGPVAADPAMRELLQKRMQLDAKLREMEKKLGDLRDEQENEAKEIQQAMRKLLRELKDVTEKLPPPMREMRPGGGFGGGVGFGGGGFASGGNFGQGVGNGFVGGSFGGPNPLPPEERERIQRHVMELQQQLGRLHQEGKREDAAAVQRQIAELQARMARAGQTMVLAFQGRPQKALSPEEREKKMKQVQEAAAKLREAGLAEQADRLVHEAEAVFSGQPQMVVVTRPGEPGEVRYIPNNAPVWREPGMPVPVRPEAMNQDLRAQMQQLQAQMQELRAELRAMRQDREPRDREPRLDRPAERRPETRDPARGDRGSDRRPADRQEPRAER